MIRGAEFFLRLLFIGKRAIIIAKITDYPTTNVLSNDDVFILENENNGTETISALNLIKKLSELLPDENIPISKSVIKSSNLYIQHSNLGGYNSADEFPANSIIEISSNVVESDISNLPAYGKLSYVITATYNAGTNYSMQIFISTETLATRIKSLSGWGVWSKKPNENEVLTYSSISFTGYNSLAELPYNIHGLINFANSENPCPWTDYPEGVVQAGFYSYRHSANFKIQFLVEFSKTVPMLNRIWMRIVDMRTNEPYNAWVKIPNENEIDDKINDTIDEKIIGIKSILSLGDSIALAARSGRKDSSKNYIGYLAYFNIEDIKNKAVAGARLSNTVSGTGCIYQQLIDFVNDPSNSDFYPDAVISNGGINDYVYDIPLGTAPTKPVVNDTEADAIDKTTLGGGLQYLFYNWIKYYPKAQRYFLLTHRDKTKPWTKNYNGGYTQTEMNDFITAICKLYSVTVIDIFNNSFLNTAFSQYICPEDYDNASAAERNRMTKMYYVDPDGVHPFDLGYEEGYAPLMRVALMTATHKT